MKKFFSILAPIILILLVVSGTYYYLTADSKNFKEQHDKYISLINDSHEFNNGLTGLKTLTTEKAKETLKNIDKEIELATILNDADSSLKNSNIDDASNKIETAKKIDSSKIFAPAISYLDNNIQNFNKAADEIAQLDKTDPALDDNIKEIVNKYSFDYINLREKLLNMDFDISTLPSQATETPEQNNSQNSSQSANTQTKKATTNNNNNSSNTTTDKSKNAIPNSSFHPQINGQQVPETYNTIRYTQEGSTSRAIIENELKGDISNFTNEQIDAAIASYNQKTSGNNSNS